MDSEGIVIVSAETAHPVPLSFGVEPRSGRVRRLLGGVTTRIEVGGGVVKARKLLHATQVYYYSEVLYFGFFNKLRQIINLGDTDWVAEWVEVGSKGKGGKWKAELP